jgi:hypothetical protein
MPNTIVPANAGGMSRFDLAAIMKAAWSECRRARTFNGKFCFGRSGREAFAIALRKAWHDAKAAAGTLPLDEIARDRRAASIRAEIDALKFKPLQMNTEWRQRALQQQLSSLVV